MKTITPITIARSLCVLCALLVLPVDAAHATKKKPSKKAQAEECTFQLDRCMGVCQDNFNGKDPNLKGDSQAAEDCNNKCRAEEKTCISNISRKFDPSLLDTQELVPATEGAQP